MQGPIYKFWHARWTEAFYQLSQAEREALMQKIDGIGKQVGFKTLAACEASWNNEQWAAFGLEEFPDMESVQKHNAALIEADWFRYIHCETMLGTAWEGPTA